MKKPTIDDLCARADRLPPLPTSPFAPPLFTTSVWQCDSAEQADELLGGQQSGYVYQRDGHPNADMLAEKCRLLHGAERAVIAGSGMAALATALLAYLQPGQHVLVSQQLYGKTQQLFVEQGKRWGIEATLFDPTSLDAYQSSLRENTRLVVVETISNPLLRVTDIAGLAEVAHRAGALLLVDNTFATPALCRPLELGADLVMESLTKLMNGHSDVVLGLLCGSADLWQDVPRIMATWGLTSSPWDCWMVQRGLATFHLRVERACHNADQVARMLSQQPEVEVVNYPGLAEHPDHALAVRQFGLAAGSMVTFHLRGGRDAARRFIASATIPFCPSLGEIATTVSHPETTSHRGLSPAERQQLGVHGGTLRLSCGIESPESILTALQAALRAAGVDAAPRGPL